jgi:iron-sulfur cluster assembly protein
MSVQLTESAASHVNRKLTERGAGVGLRLGTRKSGCTGYAYVVDYADGIGEQDEVFESHGVKVIVDKNSLPHLEGMTIDFVKTNALNEGFEFINPNVKDMCGCGESFDVN